jgi:hypothetical protein
VLLSWARTLLQSASSSWPLRCHRVLSDPVGHCSSSHEVFRTFSVFPLAAAASCERPGLPDPTDLRPQVFSTSRRVSIRCEPAGLVSCQIRSWAWTLQSLSPASWPYAVSGADPLLTLVPARSHLMRPRCPTPPEDVAEPPNRPIRAWPPKRPTLLSPSVPAEPKLCRSRTCRPFRCGRNHFGPNDSAHLAEAEASTKPNAPSFPPRSRPKPVPQQNRTQTLFSSGRKPR